MINNNENSSTVAEEYQVLTDSNYMLLVDQSSISYSVEDYRINKPDEHLQDNNLIYVKHISVEILIRVPYYITEDDDIFVITKKRLYNMIM